MADFILNGINPITGEYLIPALDDAGAANAAVSAEQAHEAVGAMHANLAKPTLGLPFPLHPDKVEEAGWGIVFHAQEDAAVKAAFAPLIQHRTQQINNPAKVKALTYNGEDFETWLANLGVAPGTVKPNRVPFYLLVVGDPALIPIEFTQLLDIEYAIGRLHLDSAADYARYAQAVVDYETAPAPTNAKEVVFFGTEHINDAATNLSCEHLVKTLANGEDGDSGIADACQFQSRKLIGPDATKVGLLGHLKRPAAQNPPAVLFSASHGLGWPLGDALQPAAQGALLCGEWKGLGFSPLPMIPAQYLSASDVQDGNVRNLIAFIFACFGLATPLRDKFSFKPPEQPQQLAPKPFFSALPKALLSAATGPALAVIGHVERAWASSIAPPGAGAQIQPFQNALGKILSGVPLGLALTDFSDRYGGFAGMMNSMLSDKLHQLPVDDRKLATTWVQQNDACAYMLFGDPAIRLRLDKLQ